MKKSATEVRNIAAQYAFSISGKNFSLHQVVKSKKELDKLLKTIEINCEFEES